MQAKKFSLVFLPGNKINIDSLFQPFLALLLADINIRFVLKWADTIHANLVHRHQSMTIHKAWLHPVLNS